MYKNYSVKIIICFILIFVDILTLDDNNDDDVRGQEVGLRIEYASPEK